MSTYLFILGRQPELSLAELQAVLSDHGSILEATKFFVVFHGHIEAKQLLSRLGGVIKIANVESEYDRWKDFGEDQWLLFLRSELNKVEGKFKFGLSLYGLGIPIVKHFQLLGVQLKKRVKATGRSARFVSNSEGQLSSVAVYKNHLIDTELIIVKGATKYYFARTIAVQDFHAYGFRDYGRPSPDPQRGMLPPKLAQIMLNLGSVQETDVLLDPFCGTGTILQEALLMGVTDVWGSDKDEQAIEKTQQNLSWLAEHYKLPSAHVKMAPIESLASTYKEDFFDLVVTEPYLGPAHLLKSRRLTRAQLTKTISDIRSVYMIFFKQLSTVIKSGGRAVVIFPIFTLFEQEYSIHAIDELQSNHWELQQPRVAQYMTLPENHGRERLVYHRDDQIVSRELTVWIKK